MRKKRRRLVLGLIAAMLAVLLPLALSQRLEVDTYTITTPEVKAEVTLAVATDLHDSFFGENQRELIAVIRAEAPDALLLVGDMCESLDEMGELGATVLEGDSVSLGGVRIAGTDDPLCLTRADWQAQLEACRAQDDIFTVLMAHRPDRAEFYDAGFDLVVSGHAHGGQLRIPGLIDGLWAPNQGWFPEYTSGLYPLEEGQLAVSRGLCKSAIPRLFNRPELVILRIVPEEE